MEMISTWSVLKHNSLSSLTLRSSIYVADDRFNLTELLQQFKTSCCDISHKWSS